jgi:hypothetical protein
MSGGGLPPNPNVSHATTSAVAITLIASEQAKIGQAYVSFTGLVPFAAVRTTSGPEWTRRSSGGTGPLASLPSKVMVVSLDDLSAGSSQSGRRAASAGLRPSEVLRLGSDVGHRTHVVEVHGV